VDQGLEVTVEVPSALEVTDGSEHRRHVACTDRARRLLTPTAVLVLGCGETERESVCECGGVSVEE
jgi:hypothetical protein